MVNAAYQVGLRNIQFVITTVDENALRIEERPHGTIAEHGRPLQSFLEVLWHLPENTGRRPDLASARLMPLTISEILALSPARDRMQQFTFVIIPVLASKRLSDTRLGSQV
jgi:hypothetical protein